MTSKICLRARTWTPAVAAAISSLCIPAISADCDAFRIMSFNICHCATHYSLSVTDDDVRRTAGVIAAQAPDFVCLQEVDKATTRSAGIDQTARIAELLTEETGVRHYGTFGKGRDYQGGEYGVAIVSREAPLSVASVPIEGSEPRCLLVCEFERLFVATVHLDNNRDYRTNSIPVIREALAALAKPVFIAGDWNATPTSDATIPMMKEFLTLVSPTNGVSTFTPRDGTEYVIDYIAIDSRSEGDFLARRAWCVPNKGADGSNSSDHNPVLVDVVARPEAGSLEWIEENAVAAGMTGAWSGSVAYDSETLTATILGDRTFTPAVPSGGNPVTNIVTATFSADRADVTPGPGVQAALRLSTNGCVQAWTKAAPGDSPAMWINLATGGAAPEDGDECTFRVVIDHVAQRYTIEMLDGDGAEWVQCTAAADGALPAGTSRFPLAASGLRVSAIDFAGETTFSSLLGTFGNRPWPTIFLVE